jgi:hypothetical protein
MHELRRSTMWSGAVLALLLVGCPGTGDGDEDGSAATEGASSDGAGACEPGEVVTCACVDGSASTQVCEPDGAAFGPCECAESDDSSGGGGPTGGAGGTTSGGESSGGSGGEASTDGGSSEDGPRGCIPGTMNACDGCPEGPGYQVCDDMGEWSACECCNGSHPEVEGDLRYCLRGFCYCGDLEIKPPVDACYGAPFAEVCCPGDIVLECY